MALNCFSLNLGKILDVGGWYLFRKITCRIMNWKEFEIRIFEYYKTVLHDIEVIHNHKIKGLISGRSRQIDIYINGRFEGKEQIVIIDAKKYNKKINIKDVESMLSMVADIGANKGILVTSIGYSRSAINRAHNDTQDFELDILRPEDVSESCGLEAIIRKAKYGAIMLAPFGWIFNPNLVGRIGFLTFAYPTGTLFEDSFKNRELIAIDIISKNAYPFTIERYFNDREILMNINPDFIVRKLIETRPIHKAKKVDVYENVFKNRNTKEFIGILDLEDFYIICYLECSCHFVERDIEKMLFVLENLRPLNVNQISILQSYLEEVEIEINNTTDLIRKSELCFLQAEMCKDFEEFDLMNDYVNKSLILYPGNYGTLKFKLKYLLEKSCDNNIIENALFNILTLDFNNPTVYFETRDIFCQLSSLVNYRGIVTKIMQDFESLLSNKALGNFYFIIATTFSIIDKGEIIKFLDLASEHFNLAEPKEIDEINMIEASKKQLELDYKKFKKQNNNN